MTSPACISGRAPPPLVGKQGDSGAVFPPRPLAAYPWHARIMLANPRTRCWDIQMRLKKLGRTTPFSKPMREISSRTSVHFRQPTQPGGRPKFPRSDIPSNVCRCPSFQLAPPARPGAARHCALWRGDGVKCDRGPWRSGANSSWTMQRLPLAELVVEGRLWVIFSRLALGAVRQTNPQELTNWLQRKNLQRNYKLRSGPTELQRLAPA